MLSNTIRLKFNYLIIIHIFHPRYHPKIIEHIVKNKQKSKHVFIHEITRLIIMKKIMKMKIRSHKYDINRPRSIHWHKCSKQKSVTVSECLYVLSNNSATFEVQFMRKLSNTAFSEQNKSIWRFSFPWNRFLLRYISCFIYYIEKLSLR